jgi:hypothetical protein
MKALLLFLALTASVNPPAPTTPTPLPTPPAPPATPAATAPPAATTSSAPSTNSAVPVAGFDSSRYEALWTKSPFAVATSEDATETSPDYMLVGIANIGGVSYASVIERQTQEHFLISSDQTIRGLQLTSITRSSDGSDSFAMVQKDGQSITLKLEQAPAAQPGAALAGGAEGAAQVMTPQIPMPGAGAGFSGASVRPFARFHRPLIHLPGQPGQQQQQPAKILPGPAATPTATPPPAPTPPPPPPQ